MMSKLLHRDYVLGTKYKDGSPYDAWGVGFYDKEKGGMHYVKDLSGAQIRLSGFKECKKIEVSTGRYILQNQDQMYLKNLWALVRELEKNKPNNE